MYVNTGKVNGYIKRLLCTRISRRFLIRLSLDFVVGLSMAYDGIPVLVAQWDQTNHNHTKFAWNASEIHIQLTNKSIRVLNMLNKNCSNEYIFIASLFSCVKIS